MLKFIPMKHISSHKFSKNPHLLDPMIGVSRTRLVKNELGEEELVRLSSLEKREEQQLPIKSGLDFLTTIKTRAMYSGKISKADTIANGINTILTTFYKKKTPSLVIQTAMRTASPIIGTKTVTTSAVGKKTDVAILTEKQSVAIGSGWLLNSARSLGKNSHFRISKNAAVELLSILSSKNSALIKKRASFYNDLWSLYNLKDDDSSHSDKK